MREALSPNLATPKASIFVKERLIIKYIGVDNIAKKGKIVAKLFLHLSVALGTSPLRQGSCQITKYLGQKPRSREGPHSVSFPLKIGDRVAEH